MSKNIRKNSPLSSMFSSLNLKAMGLLFRQLSMTLQAGIPILETLNILMKTTSDARLRRFLTDLHETVGRGESLSQGMSHWKQMLPAAVFPLIEAGEATGRIDKAFVSCSEICEMIDRTQREIKGAITYPIFLMVFSFFALSAPLFVMAGLATYLKAVLTPITILILIAIATRIILRMLHATSGFREILFVFGRRLPHLGGALVALESARFAWMLSACLRSGLDIQESLRLAAQSTADPGFIRQIERARLAIQTQGHSLSDLVASINWFPPIVLQMTSSGETSGLLPEMLDKLHEILQAEGLSKIRVFLKILPTVLFLGVAIYIAMVIIRFWTGHYANLENLLH